MGHVAWFSGNGSTGTSSSSGPLYNTTKATFNLKDGNGKIIASPTLNEHSVATYSKLITAADIGQKTIQARYTGDHVYAAGSLDTFSALVPDNNNLNANQAQVGTVNQIVAGPGVYISAPNGQGVVTISTEPLNLNNFKGNLYDISWSEIVYDYDTSHQPIYANAPYGIPGQYTAVGDGGAVFRSRDGHNWVQMFPYSTSTFYAIASEINPNYLENKMEYIAVGDGGQAATGYLGGTSDSLDNVGQLFDQNGPIQDKLYGVGIFVNDAVVVNNHQFQGGLTTDSQNYLFSASTSTGVPIVSVDTAETFAHYKITNVLLKRDDGTPTIQFSHSQNDHLKLQIDMNMDDIRFTPGTFITGYYNRLFSLPNVVIVELQNLIQTINSSTIPTIIAQLENIAFDSNNVVSFPSNTSNINYFLPYIRIYYRDALASNYPNNAWIPYAQGYGTTDAFGGWVGIGNSLNNTRLVFNIGSTQTDFNMGQIELKVDISTNASKPVVDYSFTSIVTIGA